MSTTNTEETISLKKVFEKIDTFDFKGYNLSELPVSENMLYSLRTELKKWITREKT
jgi:hypothetical protein